MRYLIRLNGEQCQFEEVTETVFQQRKYAVDDKGEPRFAEQYAVLNDAGNIVQMRLDGMNLAHFGSLARALGVIIPTGSNGSAFVKDCGPIRFHKRGQTTLVTPNGEIFTLRKAA